jgi:hypothetical protein
VVRNGSLNAVAGPGWATEDVTSVATYAASQNTTLTGVANVANIKVGSLVIGHGRRARGLCHRDEHRARGR